MNTAKKILYTMGAGIVVGLAAGVLLAPDKGVETRRKLRKLKQKLSGCTNADERKALEELSDALQKELDIVNAKIETI